MTDEEDMARRTRPPFSSWEPGPNVKVQAERNRISIPQIATRLRALAIHDPEILKVVLGHTTKRYTLAMLLEDYSLERDRQIRKQVIDSTLVLFNERLLDIYVVGKKYEDADMFRRAGTYPIYHL